MNKLASEAKEFAVASKDLVKLAASNKVDLGVAPTFMSLATVKKYAAKRMIVAAQNVNFNDHGAFTGEVSIPMLKEFKIDWVIIGHSERRAHDNETNEKCNLKVKALIANDMVPVYCVGETLDQFEAGAKAANKVRVLYGGSVKPENVKAYLSCPDVDGALVGGASLKIDSYEGLLKNIL